MHRRNPDAPAEFAYLCTKHRCVHHMKVKLNLPNHVIAAQMGWSESAVEKMVATYAHAEIWRP
jgi:hypothetical protein